MKRIRQFSKKLLTLDYLITIILLAVFLICLVVNGIYSASINEKMINTGVGLVSGISLIDLGTIAIIITGWVAQLGVSTAAYLILIKSEHKIELPMRLLNELPDDIKQSVDLTQVITTVLTSTDN